MQDKNCDVIIVNYNAGKLLLKCVASIIESDMLRIIVVDNGSTDGSLEQLESIAKKDQLSIVRNNENLGFAVACNIGFNNAKSDTILFLNPDCQLDSQAVNEMHRVLFSNEKNGMVGGFLMNPDGTEQGGGRRAIPTPWRSFVRAFGLYRLAYRWPRIFYDFHLHKQPFPEAPVFVEAISGACMMVKREAINDVGLWDEGYFLHCEDLDWCMRFRQHGWNILFVPSARVEHAHGACSKSRPVFVEWHKHKGMIRFYKKFFKDKYPFGLIWLVTLGVWLRFSVIVTLKFIKKLKP